MMKYSDRILEVMQADDMDYGDKTGAYQAIVRNIINDTAELIEDNEVDLEDLLFRVKK